MEPIVPLTFWRDPNKTPLWAAHATSKDEW